MSKKQSMPQFPREDEIRKAIEGIGVAAEKADKAYRKVANAIQKAMILYQVEMTELLIKHGFLQNK